MRTNETYFERLCRELKAVTGKEKNTVAACVNYIIFTWNAGEDEEKIFSHCKEMYKSYMGRDMEEKIKLTLTRAEVLTVMHAVAMVYNRRGDERAAALYDKINAELFREGNENDEK